MVELSDTAADFGRYVVLVSFQIRKLIFVNIPGVDNVYK